MLDGGRGPLFRRSRRVLARALAVFLVAKSPPSSRFKDGRSREQAGYDDATRNREALDARSDGHRPAADAARGVGVLRSARRTVLRLRLLHLTHVGVLGQA